MFCRQLLQKLSFRSFSSEKVWQLTDWKPQFLGNTRKVQMNMKLYVFCLPFSESLSGLTAQWSWEARIFCFARKIFTRWTFMCSCKSCWNRKWCAHTQVYVRNNCILVTAHFGKLGHLNVCRTFACLSALNQNWPGSKFEKQNLQYLVCPTCFRMLIWKSWSWYRWGKEKSTAQN